RGRSARAGRACGGRVSRPRPVGARAGGPAGNPARDAGARLPHRSSGQSDGARRARAHRRPTLRDVSGVALMLKKITALLLHQRIERRCAAAMVLGELGEKAAVPALAAALGDPDPLVQLYALEAIDALGARAQAAKAI